MKQTARANSLERALAEAKRVLDATRRSSDAAQRISLSKLESMESALAAVQSQSIKEQASLYVALDSEATIFTEAQVGPSMEAAQRYKAQLDEMRIRLDEATEATASLSTQADDYSRENAALKEQVICMLVH